MVDVTSISVTSTVVVPERRVSTDWTVVSPPAKPSMVRVTVEVASEFVTSSVTVIVVSLVDADPGAELAGTYSV